ncbi:ABC transporter permease subunit [Bradyrhizobium sp. KB893862 SZCCT0404]|uniref:ABC transporter permease subunit n=1 Tax=Bradyrhizobium sp. KB893862 SZCCT0404 TaxID=2807672 RepID=UPI001BA5B1AD|nr:ABC transporter permease subunit [Bradyrhizobium sp. KB893862 SZCCT0404]MBR1175226.1 ABC transporter permease subunit [Bradyrhizobium sp. KB893862 SZCCT0404]
MAVVVAATTAGLMLGLFDFLIRPTGWQMGFSILPQRSSDPYWWTIGLSYLNTVVLALLAVIVATVVGTVMAIIIVGRNPVWKMVAVAYVQLFRNMPLLLQALFWFAVIAHGPAPRQAYSFIGVRLTNRGMEIPILTLSGLIALTAGLFTLLAVFWVSRSFIPPQWGRLGFASLASCGAIGVAYVFSIPESMVSFPQLQGFSFAGGLHVPTEFLAIWIALSMYGSAYVAEIVRGGFQTVPVGMIEAAKSLALPLWAIEAKVRIPVALRAIVLPLASQFTVLIKATSIGLAVGFTDLFAVTLMSINQSGRTIGLLWLMTVGFVLINQLILSLFGFINRAVEIPNYGQR